VQPDDNDGLSRSVLDGFSRSIVRWDIRTSMTEADVERILERARERFPQARPRVISDNGPQFIARDFKEFICLSGMTHVRTSPFYRNPTARSNAGIQSLKAERLRPGCPLSLQDARRLVSRYVEQHNPLRLHSAFGLRHPAGHARRSAAGNLGGAKSQAGSRPPRASASSIILWASALDA
jgi:putative transposase